jgi:hypothetical protein
MKNTVNSLYHQITYIRCLINIIGIIIILSTTILNLLFSDNRVGLYLGLIKYVDDLYYILNPGIIIANLFLLFICNLIIEICNYITKDKSDFVKKTTIEKIIISNPIRVLMIICLILNFVIFNKTPICYINYKCISSILSICYLSLNWHFIQFIKGKIKNIGYNNNF